MFTYILGIQMSKIFIQFKHHFFTRLCRYKKIILQNVHDEIDRHISDTIKTYEVSIESFSSLLAAKSNSHLMKSTIYLRPLNLNASDKICIGASMLCSDLSFCATCFALLGAGCIFFMNAVISSITAQG